MRKQDQQVAAAAIVEDGSWLGRLQDELRAAIAPVFCQARSRLTAFAYIGALLAGAGDRRSCWQLAQTAGHATPRWMQALLGEHAWDWKAALKALQCFIVAHLGDPEAILVLDETAELKKGLMTVGVTRQHAGITGQVENCQTVVFLAYVTARAHALLAGALAWPATACPGRGLATQMGPLGRFAAWPPGRPRARLAVGGTRCLGGPAARRRGFALARALALHGPSAGFRSR